MFKTVLKFLAVLLLLGAAYLLLWPVKIDPVAWQPPENQGYVGDFSPNTALADIRRIDLGDHSGPEDVAISQDGQIYVSTHDGKILTINSETGKISEFADTGGRPLGIEFGPDGNLYIADAYRGLLKLDASGTVTVLTDKNDEGSPILYADDLDVTSQGVVYFTDASTKFGAEANGGTLPASLLDLLEHGPNGRVLKYDPATQQTTTIHEGMSFANGLALTRDEQHILVAETGGYAIHKISLADPSDTRVILDNLPGFPDNINDNPDGTFWFGLASPRSAPVDQLAGYPFLRKIVQRLPAFVQPKPQRYGFIARINADGVVMETLQDPDGGYALTTGAIDGPDGRLYISSLTEPDLAVLERE